MINKKWRIAFALLVLCIGLGSTHAGSTSSRGAADPVKAPNNAWYVLYTVTEGP